MQDDLQILAQLAHLSLRNVGDILIAIKNPAFVGLYQSEERAPERGFAAARLANQPQGLAFVNVEGNVVKRIHILAARKELFPPQRIFLGQVFNTDERLALIELFVACLAFIALYLFE